MNKIIDCNGLMTPGEYLDNIAHNEEINFPDIYYYICECLFDKSFSSEIYFMKDKIMEIMPDMDKQLRDANAASRTLKIALDVGKLHKVNREQEHRLIVEAAFIVLMYIHVIRNTLTNDTPKVKFYTNYEDVLTTYGMFKDFESIDISEIEQKKLIYFANFMKISVLVMQKPKKAHLLDLVTRMAEGRVTKYITGSGQTPFTARRVYIFEVESGVKPTPRPPRKEKKENSSDESTMLSHSVSSKIKQQISTLKNFLTNFNSNNAQLSNLAVINSSPVNPPSCSFEDNDVVFASKILSDMCSAFPPTNSEEVIDIPPIVNENKTLENVTNDESNDNLNSAQDNNSPYWVNINQHNFLPYPVFPVTQYPVPVSNYYPVSHYFNPSVAVSNGFNSSVMNQVPGIPIFYNPNGYNPNTNNGTSERPFKQPRVNSDNYVPSG
mmetsp:Transcript_5718/g.5131  ORF Transcript_5718/g.5131 Transcript_5718/m.5131 type:complete len:437 (-) Transcript_5718:128-1438(-)